MENRMKVHFEQGRGKTLQVTLSMRGSPQAVIGALVNGLPHAVLVTILKGMQAEARRRGLKT